MLLSKALSYLHRLKHLCKYFFVSSDNKEIRYLVYISIVCLIGFPLANALGELIANW